MANAGHNLTAARQHTLKNAIDCTGVGLHSGAKVSLTLSPADTDTGIVFRRTDLGEEATIAARWGQCRRHPPQHHDRQ